MISAHQQRLFFIRLHLKHCTYLHIKDMKISDGLSTSLSVALRLVASGVNHGKSDLSNSSGAARCLTAWDPAALLSSLLLAVCGFWHSTRWSPNRYKLGKKPVNYSSMYNTGSCPSYNQTHSLLGAHPPWLVMVDNAPLRTGGANFTARCCCKAASKQQQGW